MENCHPFTINFELFTVESDFGLSAFFHVALELINNFVFLLMAFIFCFYALNICTIIGFFDLFLKKYYKYWYKNKRFIEFEILPISNSEKNRYREVINNNNTRFKKRSCKIHKNCGAVHSGSIKLIIRGKFDPNYTFMKSIYR